MSLSNRQQSILDFIRDFSTKSKYPPTLREIGDAVGISSQSVVNYNLTVLENKGLIERDRAVSRGIKLTGEREVETSTLIRLPVLGDIETRRPVPLPDKSFQTLGKGFVEITRDLLPISITNLYALQVRGNSMVDAMISDGDIVVVQHREWINNGELAVVWLKDRKESTLKRLYLEKGQVRLQPANPTMSAVCVERNAIEVQGIVVLVIRRTI